MRDQSTYLADAGRFDFNVVMQRLNVIPVAIGTKMARLAFGIPNRDTQILELVTASCAYQLTSHDYLIVLSNPAIDRSSIYSEWLNLQLSVVIPLRPIP